MDKHTALSKIRKLLNLSSSPNENEAAAALRQARSLMQRFDISQEDLELADITMHAMAGKNRIRHDEMEWQLLSLIARVFHVKVIALAADRSKNRRLFWLLFGRPSRIEVVEYFYQTLLRLLMQKRRLYLRTLSGTAYSRAQKSKLVTAFWVGWLSGVAASVQILAIPETEEALIDRSIQRATGGEVQRLVKSKPISFDGVDGRGLDAAYESGKRSGEAVSLHHGVSGQAPEPVAALASPAASTKQ